MSEADFSHAFSFLPQGAIVQRFIVADRNIVLGFPSASSYASDVHPYFGETIGRVANRISGAQIDGLNGTSYSLVANNGPNTAHGGLVGWGKRSFTGPTITERHGRQAIAFTYLSPDGEEGFPGTVELRVWYFPSVNAVDGHEVTTLEIEYEAELVGDGVEETVVSLTNHR
jgi:aldose 1-epimerase